MVGNKLKLNRNWSLSYKTTKSSGKAPVNDSTFSLVLQSFLLNGENQGCSDMQPGLEKRARGVAACTGAVKLPPMSRNSTFPEIP